MIEIMYKNFIDQIFSGARKRHSLSKGSYLFRQEERVKSVFILEEGHIELTRHQQDGTLIVLHRANEQMLLAEASVYSDTYHCDAICASDSIVHQTSKRDFLKQLNSDPTYSEQWAAYLAREVQAARYKSEILSRKTVAERLDGWMAWNQNKLPSKGDWKNIATQIGVSPEALYRELAKRRNRKER